MIAKENVYFSETCLQVRKKNPNGKQSYNVLSVMTIQIRVEGIFYLI